MKMPRWQVGGREPLGQWEFRPLTYFHQVICYYRGDKGLIEESLSPCCLPEESVGQNGLAHH
jgi:hypothetical protein